MPIAAISSGYFDVEKVTFGSSTAPPDPKSASIALSWAALVGEKKSTGFSFPLDWTFSRTTLWPRAEGGVFPGAGAGGVAPFEVTTTIDPAPSDMIPDPDCQMPPWAVCPCPASSDHRVVMLPLVETPITQPS